MMYSALEPPSKSIFIACYFDFRPLKVSYSSAFARNLIRKEINAVGHKQPHLWPRFGGMIEEEVSVLAVHLWELVQFRSPMVGSV